MTTKKVLKKKNAEVIVKKPEPKVAVASVAQPVVAKVSSPPVAQETEIQKIQREAREIRRQHALNCIDEEATKAKQLEIDAIEAKVAAEKAAMANEAAIAEASQKKLAEEDRVAKKAADIAKREEERKRNNAKMDQRVIPTPTAQLEEPEVVESDRKSVV